jgi:hypothetical protein
MKMHESLFVVKVRALSGVYNRRWRDWMTAHEDRRGDAEIGAVVAGVKTG